MARRTGASLGISLLLALLLSACGSRSSGTSPCLDGGNRCAASQAPPGLRGERRGFRIGRYHWLRRANRESGVPDVGIQAEWRPIREQL